MSRVITINIIEICMYHINNLNYEKNAQKQYMYDMSCIGYVTVLKLQLCKYEFKLGSAYVYIVFFVI